jgi:ribulose-phosphate 3-epimerase
MNPIFPSILSTKFFDLESRLAEFSVNKIDFIHLDVMDGHFVDNISFGPATIPAIRSKFQFKFDSHLMVKNPERMIPWFIEAGSDWISFHIETNRLISENLDLIKSHGRKAGLVLNPDTPVERVFPYLNRVDYILMMSVFPGYGGQKFITSTPNRIQVLKKKIIAEELDCLIQVDGGVNTDNLSLIHDAGADIVVIGTFLYSSRNISETITRILTHFDGE